MGAVSRPCVKPPTGTGSAFSLADLSVARCRPGPSLVENVEPGQIWPSAPVHLGDVSVKCSRQRNEQAGSTLPSDLYSVAVFVLVIALPICRN